MGQYDVSMLQKNVKKQKSYLSYELSVFSQVFFEAFFIQNSFLRKGRFGSWKKTVKKIFDKKIWQNLLTLTTSAGGALHSKNLIY